MGKSDKAFPMAPFVGFPYIGFDKKYECSVNKELRLAKSSEPVIMLWTHINKDKIWFVHSCLPLKFGVNP